MQGMCMHRPLHCVSSLTLLLLRSGMHDGVVISLIKDTIEDSPLPEVRAYFCVTCTQLLKLLCRALLCSVTVSRKKFASALLLASFFRRRADRMLCDTTGLFQHK
jgi:hypothetical protein